MSAPKLNESGRADLPAALKKALPGKDAGTARPDPTSSKPLHGLYTTYGERRSASGKFQMVFKSIETPL